MFYFKAVCFKRENNKDASSVAWLAIKVSANQKRSAVESDVVGNSPAERIVGGSSGGRGESEALEALHPADDHEWRAARGVHAVGERQ